MRYSVCKRFDFPAAHSNSHHQGHCNRKHGHTWVLEVRAQGPLVDQDDRGDFGMVVDFQRLKEAYARRVEPFVEHHDLDETLAFLPERTTELIAGWALEQLREDCPEVTSVRLWEGTSSYAEVTL
jgi:6-pyruvoyltetrahydropterin/6-carboxytetrahydropterin synthase